MMIKRSFKIGVTIAAVLLFCNLVLAQSTARDRRIIKFARNLNVARLDHRLPGRSFEKWLRSFVGRTAIIKWEVDDCGEQDGNASNPMNLNPPLCANARTQINGNELGIAIAVGWHKSGISGKPAIVYTYLTNRNAPSKLLELAEFIKRNP